MRTLLALLGAAVCAAAADTPRLVVVISVDQLRPDTLARFEKEYRGGLKRLLDGGLRFRGVLDHGSTQTGPGHSTMLTGCRPARTGIVANTWLNRATLNAVYCVWDPLSPVFGAAGWERGRSPRIMLRNALGDWMKAANGRARVFAVGGKDRAAITLGGHHADGVYWFDRQARGFTTSLYYHLALPWWVREFNDDGWLAGLPKAWEYEPVDWLRPDDAPGESKGFSNKSPHPLGSDDPRKLFARLYESPFVDEFTLRMAAEVVRRFDLGGDPVCDLLAISLSATDTVGHRYGPFSQEIRDTVLRLDRGLGRFFALLDKRGVRFAVALTADHGVLPIPQIKQRIDPRRALQPLAVAVQKRFGAGNWFRFSAGEIYLNRAEAEKKGVALKEVAQTLVEAARALAITAAAFSMPEGAGGGELEKLTRKSWHPYRSGDVVLIAKKEILVTIYRSGTSHGSPWRYDREVPLLFYGPGIEPGARDREARTIDIAPTLARLLGVPAPADLDGVALALD